MAALISLYGVRRSGKSTLAQHLFKAYMSTYLPSKGPFLYVGGCQTLPPADFRGTVVVEDPKYCQGYEEFYKARKGKKRNLCLGLKGAKGVLRMPKEELPKRRRMVHVEDVGEKEAERIFQEVCN